MHPTGGTWETESVYNGVATITVHGAVAVIRGLHADCLWSDEVRKAALLAIVAKGASVLTGIHKGKLWVWSVPQQEKVNDHGTYA